MAITRLALSQLRLESLLKVSGLQYNLSLPPPTSLSLSLSPLTHTHTHTGYIGSIDVQHIPTVRLGGQAVATVQPKLNSSLPYEGPLSYHIVGERGKNLTYIETIDDLDGSLQLRFMPTSDGISSKDTIVTFNIWNHVSSFASSQSVTIVGELSVFDHCADVSSHD